tara:strand:+ start:692 stop:970 length:279 start_codon:yes stop_codon:yes gene_type:complete
MYQYEEKAMNKDDIIRLALDVICEPIWFDWKNPTCRDSLLRFIQEQVRAAGADEREACARVCIETGATKGNSDAAFDMADHCAAAIRARGEK